MATPNTNDVHSATPTAASDQPHAPDTSAMSGDSNYVPGLRILGSTYDVLNGKYADSKSALQQVIDWSKIPGREEKYGDKVYIVPEIVNYITDIGSEYRASSGKNAEEYSESLSIHAGFKAGYRGFSASASADYSDSQRKNLSHSFTRITYVVTAYQLSLPPTHVLVDQIRKYSMPWFINDLDTRDPLEFYKAYGTHMLRSLTIGGRALFLNSTDTRSYSSETSIGAAAQLSAEYLVASGKIKFSKEKKEAMEKFSTSSETTVITRGGDSRYGNEGFFKGYAGEWAGSVKDYPEFIDFGPLPPFIELWELASTKERREILRDSYDEYVKRYARNFKIEGPFLKVRHITDFDETKDAPLAVQDESSGANKITTIQMKNLFSRSDGWYVVSPGVENIPAVIASELVPGALAPVRWERAFSDNQETGTTDIWRAIPPSSDYIALGCIASVRTKATNSESQEDPSEPPAHIAARFRAVHRSAVMTAKDGVTKWWHYANNARFVVYLMDNHYVRADTIGPFPGDCYILDPNPKVNIFEN